VAGVVVLLSPATSLVALAVILSVWLLLFGIMEIMLAFQLRSIGHAAGVAPAT
jgi:uncharacterized membrane protein HdeD (DUF308 family)